MLVSTKGELYILQDCLFFYFYNIYIIVIWGRRIIILFALTRWISWLLVRNGVNVKIQ